MSAQSYPPPSGLIPVLQYCLPEQLSVDPDYQRSIENGRSAKLIRTIAQAWNWELCQPLVVNRRLDGALYVIDGQHRLAAARLRGDIAQLPCVITTLADPALEAERFVAFNSRRKPLTPLEIYRAALASGDPKAKLVATLVEKNGFTVSKTSNNQQCKPDTLTNPRGIEKLIDRHGERPVDLALNAMGQSWRGERYQYAGTILPGVTATITEKLTDLPNDPETSETFTLFVEYLRGATQAEWYAEIMAARGSGISTHAASAKVIGEGWDEVLAELMEEAA